MKKLFLLGMAALALSACTTQQLKLECRNDLPEARIDEGFSLNRDQISAWTRIPEKKLPVVLDTENIALPCQLIDHDQDGKWDELFIVSDFDSSEIKVLNLRFVSPDRYPVTETRTNIRFGDKKNNYTEFSSAIRLKHANNTETNKMFQMEGPAWENDRVAFRNYFDQRNGMDIFGKTTCEMILDSVGILGFPGYHELSWWGMDVLKVDQSLGAGSIAIDLNDSLYRVGDNSTGTYTRLYEGPLRSAFELGFENWHMSADSADISHVISIQAGEWFYESTVTMERCEKPVLLVTGIVNKKSKELHTLELNKDYTAFYTLDHQAEDSSLLCMALVVDNTDLVNYGRTADEGPGITKTFFVRLKVSNDQALRFRFYSLWEREDEKWSQAAMIEEKLKDDARRFSSPIQVSLEE